MRLVAVTLLTTLALAVAACGSSGGSSESGAGATTTVVGGTTTVEGGATTVVGGATTVVGGTTTVVGGTTSGGGTTAPADFPGEVKAIATDLDAILANLRNVRSLKQFRANLEDAATRVRARAQALEGATVPSQYQAASERVEKALNQLAHAIDRLAAKAQNATAADLGKLARQLLPGQLAGADEARKALEEITRQLGATTSG